MVDVGSYSTRAGYAGEDMPKADFPSYVGVIDEYTEKAESMDIGTVSENIKSETGNKSQKRYLLETMSIKSPKENMQVQSFLKDCLIDDWDLFERMLRFTFDKHLRCDPTRHPILMSEPVVCTLLFFHN